MLYIDNMTPILRDNFVEMLEYWQLLVQDYKKQNRGTPMYERGQYDLVVRSLKILKKNIPKELIQEIDGFIGIDEFRID